MTTIGYATLQIIPSLRGVREAINRQVRDLSIDVGVDVDGAREAGVRAGRDIRQGLTGARIAAGLHRQIQDELSSANATSTGNSFGSSLASSIMSSVRSIRGGFDSVVASGGSVLRNIGAIATGTKVASVAARVLSRSLLAAGGALALLGGGGVGRLAVGLGLVGRAAGGAARDITRITSSLIVLYAVGRGISFLNNIGRMAAVGTIGLSALLGVATGVAALLGGPMVAALTAMASAMGVAAGAAAGILGPALLTLGLGFKGMQDAAKAYTSSDGGASQAKAIATASKQVEQAEKGVERAKRDSRDAERDLTRARKDALEQIEDMQLALKGSALTEKDAQLSLLEARRDLQNLGKDGQSFDMLDRERAILRVQEAEQRLAETQESNGDLNEKAAEQNRVGVEGSDEVVAAKQRVADANQAVIDSQQQLTEALQAATDAQSAGQSGVDPFDLMIGQRMAPAIDAVKSLKQTITDSLTTELVPAFGTFGGLVDAMKPKLAGLAGIFGGIGTSVVNALSGPVARKGFDNMIAGSSAFFTAFKGGAGLGGLAAGLASFAGTAATTFSGVGAGINDALGDLGDKLRSITPEQMTAAFEKLQQIFQNIRDVVGPIFSALRELAGISAPALAPGFKAIGDAIAQATPGVMAMARDLMPALGQVMQNLAPILPSIVESFRPWATILSAIAPSIATIVSHLGPLAPLIFGVALAAKGIGAAMLLWNTGMAAASVGLGIFAAATGRSTAFLGTNTIALFAHRGAMIVGAAATGVMSVATAAFNAVLAGNPIALVVLALAALVAGVVVAYKNSETFRNVVQAAWQGIKNVIGVVWDWISNTLWPGIKAVFEGIGDVAMWLWNNALKPTFDFIAGAWKVLWFGIQVGWELGKAVFEAIKSAVLFMWTNVWQPAFQGIAAIVGTAWQGIQVVFELIKAGISAVGDAGTFLWHTIFEPVWEGIKSGWDTLMTFLNPIFEVFKTGMDGIGGVASKIADGIKSAWSGIETVFKTPLHALGGFLADLPSSVLGIEIPFISDLHSWGENLKKLSGGGYTGSMPIDQVAGVVHGDEHVIKSTSRRRIENAYPGLLDFLNDNGRLPMPGYADGGRVMAKDLSQFASGVEGKKYVWGGTNWGDCSGAVSALANYATGRPPFSSRFATGTEASELAARGFKSGLGPAGSLNVGWFNGGPYGGHTAATLPDGTNFEMGGRRGNGQYGGGAAGANNPQFTDHAYLPPEYFLAGAVSNGLQLDGGAPTTGTPASANDLANGQFSGAAVAALPSAGGGSSGGGVPSSFSGLASLPFSNLGVTTQASSTSPQRTLDIGSAASEAVGGQVKSALGVFGLNDAPPFLQAASKLISGIKVSGKDGTPIFDGANPLGGLFGQNSAGSSVAPLSATSSGTGTILPGAQNQHGLGTGQAPGPGGDIYNVTATNTEEAIERLQKQKDQNANRLIRS